MRKKEAEEEHEGWSSEVAVVFPRLLIRSANIHHGRLRNGE